MHRAIITCFLTVLVTSGLASARPGDYDPAFRYGGRVYSGLGDAVVVQPDGKLLIDEHYDVDRYLADGTPDLTFDSEFEQAPTAGLVDQDRRAPSCM